MGDGGRADRELSDIEQNDADDFGDFQGVCAAGNEAPGEQERECLGGMPGTTSQDWDNSQISSQPLSQESESSRCRESEPSRHRAACSPPPLDCVAKDTAIQDGFSSSFPPADDNDDDDDADFGNFASHEADFDLPSGANIEDKCSLESSLHPHDFESVPENKMMKGDHEEMASSASVHQINSTTERLQADGDSEEEDSVCKSSRVARSVEKEGSEDEQEGKENFTSFSPKGFLSSEEETQVGTQIISEIPQSPSLDAENERGAADGMASSQGSAWEGSEENTVVAPTTSASDDGVDEEQRTGDRSGLDKGSPSLRCNESVVPESDKLVKGSDTMVKGREKEVKPSSDTAGRSGDVCVSDNESDFGDFNQAEDDEEDDDLDFADLRKQVEDGTFGDFSSGFGDGNEGGEFFAGDGDGNADDDDGFGDFAASADINAKAEFDDFGDFVVHGKESAEEDDFSQNIDDDFGDFSAPENSGALRGFTTAPVEETPQFPPQDDGVCKTSPILQKVRKGCLFLVLFSHMISENIGNM